MVAKLHKDRTMRAGKLLHNLIKNTCKRIDKRIQGTLFEAAEALTRCKSLSILGLGRALSSKALVKHNIKRIDRLVGNKRLHKDSHEIYRGLSNLLLNKNQNPIIVVDWSGLTRCGAYHVLRASVAVGGRALTLYDQAYKLKDYTSEKTHRKFLKKLKAILPLGCHPIIVTDAGFRNTWFKAVERNGWDFVGRIRHRTKYKYVTDKTWEPIKNLYAQAIKKASFLGEVFLAKSSAMRCYIYIKGRDKKYRERRNLAGKKLQCSVSKKHEKRCQEPWLIATSLAPDKYAAESIMQIYQKRMQIEESFRDLKNTHYGFSLRHCRSYQVDRLNTLLLIAALAMLILWILGTAVKQKGLHYSFQANTEKRRNVLSNFMIGWQLLIRDELHLKKKELLNAIDIIILSACGEIK